MTAMDPEAREHVVNRIDRMGALVKVLAETDAQVAKWGIQHHPDGTGDEGYVPNATSIADGYRVACDAAAEEGRLTWRHILLEEVFEAMAEGDPEKLVTELIQVAAVAVSWAVDIESRRTPG